MESNDQVNEITETVITNVDDKRHMYFGSGKDQPITN